jgi:uncharacterized membrane protein
MSAAGLVFASAGFGSVYAWSAGSPYGYLMAGLMVLMAVALECAKPLAAASAFSAFRRFAVVRGSALALLAIVAVVFSLTAELSLMATTRTDLIAQRTADAKAAKSVDGQRDRVEAELAKLTNIRPVATLKAEIDGMLIDPRVGDCATIDGPRSKAACPKVAALKGELGNAERKAQLEATLAALQTAAPAAADKAGDPGAQALSTYLASLGIALPSSLLTEWMVLVSVAALELGSALSVLLVQTVSVPATERQTPRQTEQNTERPAETQPATPQIASTPAKPGQSDHEPDPTPPGKRTPKRKAKRTRRNAKRRLGNVVRLVRANGGKVTASQQSLARQLRLSKTRVNELLRQLEATGQVKLYTSRAGTTVALAA